MSDQKPKVLNFGSLNIDCVYQVDHFVAPGETLLSSRLDLFCGGKGLNQSIALARAGVPVFHAGKIGQDGQLLLDRLRENNVDTRYVRVVDGPSGHAIIQVNPAGQNCILLFGGANQRVGQDDIDPVLADFGQGDILLLQNEISSIKYLMEKASEKGMLIAFNPSPANESLATYPLGAVRWFILNEIEGAAISGETESIRIADRILAAYPGSSVILTLGEKGVLYKDSHEEYRQGIFDVPAVDTTAAGDTFTGYFLAGIASGLGIPDVLRRASLAAAIAVSRPGASDSVPRLDEVMRSGLQEKSHV